MSRTPFYDEPMTPIMVNIPQKIRAWLDDKKEQSGSSRAQVIRGILWAAMGEDQGEQ